ncbi:MAG: ATP-binding protein [Acidimicrobiales bacterium]
MEEPPHRELTEVASTWDRRTERSARCEFDDSIHAPAAMRDFVRASARGWGLGDVGSLAELLVSEIVTNAVEHGGSGGVVEVEALPAGLRVAVTDHAAGRPVLRNPRDDEPTGRGLAIVDRLSRWWGVETTPNGKVVWFEVDDVDVSSQW